MKNKFFDSFDEIKKSKHYFFFFNGINELKRKIIDVEAWGCTDEMRDQISVTDEKSGYMRLGLLLPMDGIDQNYYEIFLDMFFKGYKFYNRLHKSQSNGFRIGNRTKTINSREISQISLGFRYSDTRKLIIKRDLNCAIAVFDLGCKKEADRAWLLAAIHRRILLNTDRFNDFLKKVTANNKHNKYYGTTYIRSLTNVSIIAHHSDILFTSLMYYIYHEDRDKLDLLFDIIPKNPSIIFFSRISRILKESNNTNTPCIAYNSISISKNFEEIIERLILESSAERINENLSSLFGKIAIVINKHVVKIHQVCSESIQNKINEV